jgi:aldehyde:ferredoxin oxidoreductase
VITKSDTEGMELHFGDADLMIKLVEMTARREGFGDLLAEGMERLADKWGVKDKPYYLAVKGQELPMHDPRVKVGVGMGYVLSPYGADHMYAAHDTLFTDDKFLSFQAIKPLGIHKALHATQITSEKVRVYALLDNVYKMYDALGLCAFGYAPRGVMSLERMVQCLNAITGWNTNLFELMNAAERGTTMARAFNSREGITIKDDKLPKRLYDPKPHGPNAGEKIFEEKDFDNAIRLFYAVIGVDPETGRPRKGKLVELGLEWVEELY